MRCIILRGNFASRFYIILKKFWISMQRALLDIYFMILAKLIYLSKIS